jgi:tetratricopeptide (TPR) repeat protein
MSSPVHAGWRSRDAWIAGAIVFCMTLWTFLPAVNFGFIELDDPGYVTENMVVQSGLNARSVVWSVITFQMANWHPVTWWSYLVDFELYGLDPAGYHRTSVLWHAATALMLFLALWRLTKSVWGSFCAVLLFAVHPLRLESVVWISERKDVLSGFFFALALWCYAGDRTSRWWMPRVAAAMALGLGSKPIVVILPLVLLALDFWPLRRWTPRPGGLAELCRLVFEKRWLIALAAASCALTIASQHSFGALATTTGIPLPLRLANAANSTVAYLGSLLWPANARIYYCFPDLTAVDTVIHLGVIALISLMAWRMRSQFPALLTGWTWYLVALLPVIGLLQVGGQARADRYTYLASIGITLALTFTLLPLTARGRAGYVLTGMVALGVLVASASQVRAQLPSWQDSRALYSRAVSVDPGCAWSLARLATAEWRNGDHQTALRLLESAASTDPYDPHTQSALALLYSHFERHDEALAASSRAQALAPPMARLHSDAALVAWRAGLHLQATLHLLAVIALEPRSPAAYDHLAVRIGEGLDAGTLERALGRVPDPRDRARLSALLPESAAPPAPVNPELSAEGVARVQRAWRGEHR